jgi:hypothetical protein
MADPKQETWRVHGTVVEEDTDRPLAGLIVRAFDRDLVFDDKLGFTTTDASGHFEIRYTSDRFRDLWEARPDLYLRVFSADGTHLVHETVDAVRWGAGTDERYRIVVPPRALDPRRSGG